MKTINRTGAQGGGPGPLTWPLVKFTRHFRFINWPIRVFYDIKINSCGLFCFEPMSFPFLLLFPFCWGFHVEFFSFHDRKTGKIKFKRSTQVWIWLQHFYQTRSERRKQHRIDFHICLQTLITSVINLEERPSELPIKKRSFYNNSVDKKNLVIHRNRAKLFPLDDAKTRWPLGGYSIILSRFKNLMEKWEEWVSTVGSNDKILFMKKMHASEL